MNGGAIGIKELFSQLAEGHAARVTVLTPNLRLAQALTREFDARQVARGLASWEAPDILPLQAFLARAWDDALHAEGGDALAELLTPAEEQHLWEEAIRDSRRELLAVAQTAAQCRDAWALSQAWRIAPGGGSEDAEAFAEWSRAYLKRAGDDVDAARLADRAAPLVDPARTAMLVAYAFDILTPQAREFFAACEGRGIRVCACAPPRAEAAPVRAPFPSSREELEAAATWARARVEAGAQRVGIVVPELQQRRREVARVLTRVMGSPRAFDISLGVPLADYPLVDAALAILEFAHRDLDFGRASRLLRSPFLGGAEAECSRRATLDARLRRKLPATLSLAKLTAAVAHCPQLRERLEAVYGVAQGAAAGAQGPQQWARHFSALLDAAGFPGERTLDSAEYQACAKWHETLAGLAKLERVAPRMGLAQALSKLRRACAETLFQPESAGGPVQVLGILESAGLAFEHLWVSGLHDEAWPLHARPNPFIPIALQKKAGIPEASAEGSYALDARITQDWLSAAAEVVVSHPLRADDRELGLSPLIAQVPEGAPDLPPVPRHRDLLFAARRLEEIPDGVAPALASSPPAPLPAEARGANPGSPLPLAGEGQGVRAGVRVRGGAKVLSDQAACPFRAFARHRLGARALEEPEPGLSAMDRGTLLHALMKRLWDALGGSAALAGDTSAAIDNAAAGAVADLEIEGRMAELERARLARLARDWLAVERERTPFTVVATESERTIAIGALQLSGRIDRLDRLADGSHALIDYKTGNVTRADWLGERPNDPQLPLYAVTAAEDIGAVAFARLKAGEMKYSGYAREQGFVDKAKDWNALVAGWKAELETLAGGFAAGDARVDPKKLAQTCRLCDLQPLCRVHEKLALLEGEEGE